MVREANYHRLKFSIEYHICHDGGLFQVVMVCLPKASGKYFLHAVHTVDTLKHFL